MIRDRVVDQPRGRQLNKLLKDGLAAVPNRILLFDHAGGKVLAGLTRRQTAELTPYLTA